ncbi:MAG TPA: cache domain-containing protein [Armatimonadota bacterium]|jgi:PAS domain S-box-containing protein
MDTARAKDSGVQPAALWSLRVRTLLLVFLSVAPAFALMAHTAGEQRRHAARLMRDGTLRLARVAAADAEGRVESAREFLNAMAEFPVVRARNARDATDLFARLHDQYPSYANFGLVDRQGRILASSVPLRGKVNVRDRSYFLRCIATQDFAVGDYQVGRVTGKPAINFAYPVYDARGRFVAVVFTALDMDWVSNLAGWRLPAGSTLTILDERRTVLYRYPDPARYAGRKMPELSIGSQVVTNREGVAEAVGADGQPRLFAFSQVATGATRVFVAIGVPLTAVYGEVDRVYHRNVISLALVAALALLAAWVGGDWFFLRQVKALMRAARELSAGDLTARTGLRRGRDELSQLTVAFDEMAESLEHITGAHELILRSAGEGIYGMNAAGLTTFVNPAAARMLGYSAEDLVGRRHHDVLRHMKTDGTEYPSAECPMYAAFQDGAVHRGDDEVFIRKDGSSFPVDYVATPAWEHGQIVGAVVTFRDITERRRAEEEVALAHEQLLLASAEKKRFYREVIRSVTHDKLHLVDPNEIPTEGRLMLDLPLETPEDDRSTRRQIREAAISAGISPERARELVMAVGEATTNAVKHATGGRCALYQAKDRIVARVSDHGAGIPTDELPVSLLQPGYSTKVSMGLGYTLMLELADRVWLSTGPDGTILQLEKWIEPAERPSSPLLAAVRRVSAPK